MKWFEGRKALRNVTGFTCILNKGAFHLTNKFNQLIQIFLGKFLEIPESVNSKKRINQPKSPEISMRQLNKIQVAVKKTSENFGPPMLFHS